MRAEATPSSAVGRLRCALLALGASFALAACATFTAPQPWEKGDLAKRAMQFDSDALNVKLEQHIYTSKEAAGGGYGVGGGGCGCN